MDALRLAVAEVGWKVWLNLIDSALDNESDLDDTINISNPANERKPNETQQS